MNNGSFTFINYSGPNADKILTALVSDGPEEKDEHDIVSQVQRVVGFQMEEDEDDDEED